MQDVIESKPENTDFLDTIGARIVAIVIAVIAGFLLFLAYDNYRGATGGIFGGIDKSAFDACVEERMEAFNKLAVQAEFSPERRAVGERNARESADVVCAEQARPDK